MGTRRPCTSGGSSTARFPSSVNSTSRKNSFYGQHAMINRWILYAGRLRCPNLPVRIPQLARMLTISVGMSTSLLHMFPDINVAPFRFQYFPQTASVVDIPAADWGSPYLGCAACNVLSQEEEDNTARMTIEGIVSRGANYHAGDFILLAIPPEDPPSFLRDSYGLNVVARIEKFMPSFARPTWTDPKDHAGPYVKALLFGRFIDIPPGVRSAMFPSKETASTPEVRSSFTTSKRILTTFCSLASLVSHRPLDRDQCIVDNSTLSYHVGG